MAMKDHTPGEIRYFTYFLNFPDGERWVDQIEFIHDLQWELKHSCFEMEPFKKSELLTKGETWWRDHNSVEHHVKIEKKKRARTWGKGVAKKIGSIR